jgi:threonine/homoserine/homoserine lactone efflux protein
MAASMNFHISLSIFHILVVAPFLFYVAFVRGQMEPWIFSLLQILGVLILIYHSYKIMVRWRAHSPAVWINILHVLTIAPLLIFIGNRAFDTPRWAFEVLAMLAFATLGYHLYSIVMSIQEMFDSDYKKKSEKRIEETNPHAQTSNS